MRGRGLCEDLGDAHMRVCPQVLPVRGFRKKEVIVQDPQEEIDSGGVDMVRVFS